MQLKYAVRPLAFIAVVAAVILASSADLHLPYNSATQHFHDSHVLAQVISEPNARFSHLDSSSVQSQSDSSELSPAEEATLDFVIRHIVAILIISLLVMVAAIFMVIDISHRYGLGWGCAGCLLFIVAGWLFWIPIIIVYLFLRASVPPKTEWPTARRVSASPTTLSYDSSPAQMSNLAWTHTAGDTEITEAERDERLEELIASSSWQEAEAYAQSMLKTASGFGDARGVNRYQKYLARIRSRMP